MAQRVHVLFGIRHIQRNEVVDVTVGEVGPRHTGEELGLDVGLELLVGTAEHGFCPNALAEAFAF